MMISATTTPRRYAGTITLRADGLAPSAKYSAHTMNDAQIGRQYTPSQMPKGSDRQTVIATASHKGTVFFVSVTGHLQRVRAWPTWSMRPCLSNRGRRSRSGAGALRTRAIWHFHRLSII